MAFKDIISKFNPTSELDNVESIRDNISQKIQNVSSKAESSIDKINNFDFSNLNLDSINSDKIVNTITPYIQSTLLGLVNTEKIVNEATKDSLALLNRKGRVEIKNQVEIYFYPIQDGPWLQIKEQFDRKIQVITNNLNKITKLISTINKTLNIINTVLTALEIYLQIKKLQLEVQLKTSGVEQASPSPSKPTTGITLSSLQQQIDAINKAQNIINSIQDVIKVIRDILVVLNTLLSKVKIKLSQAKLEIITNQAEYPDTKDNLTSSFNSAEVPLTLEETIISNGIQYTIKIVNLQNGFNKAVAYDTLSGLLVTQTAPSITQTPYELIQELKQILS